MEAGVAVNIQNSMARNRKKPKLGNHQTGFVADSSMRDVRQPSE